MMSAMTTQPVNPREAAREWVADTIRTHLHPDLQPVGGADRIRKVAEALEDEAHEQNMPIEMAVSLAVEWCKNQNEESGSRTQATTRASRGPARSENRAGPMCYRVRSELPKRGLVSADDL
jgi:hypothetical protein